ncbi:MAG TPA: GntR family transcriptional regulator [Bacillota bacterium]
MEKLNAYRTKSELVYLYLREAIVDGELTSDRPLKTTELAQQLGVSEVPVREALVRLQAEGFIHREANAIARVVGLNRQEVRELNLIRSRLEGLATKLATERDPALAQRLKPLIDRMRKAHENGDNAAYMRCNNRFHEIIIEASAAQWLIRSLTDLRDMTKRFQMVLKLVPERERDSLQEHLQIFDAIQAGDADRAEVLAREHRMRASDQLEAYLAAKERAKERARDSRGAATDRRLEDGGN